MEQLIINGKKLTPANVHSALSDAPPHLSAIRSFLEEWWNDENYIVVKTSGSTGMPKEIELSKKLVKASADQTCDFFDLNRNTTGLLCLPVHYIAGKLMLVRAIRSGMPLIAVEPTMTAICHLEANAHFAALIPSQVVEALSDAVGTAKLSSIPMVLIGGGPIDRETEARLAELPNACYHSYGMTETATHVALRRIGMDARYHALPGVRFEKDIDGALIIHASYLAAPVHTTDLAEIHNEQSFTWLGRTDHAVISGGVKLIPELIEKKIGHLLESRFYLRGETDHLLGQKLVLMLEGSPWSEDRIHDLQSQLHKLLNKFERPKEIRFESRFEETTSGKIRRLSG
ncbi:MAG: AMP-dependent synthetase [Cryomorphaceae bacterium]|nr:MAG: AMP-dependent synthetase [Cryomorphaceae bacterium]